MVPGLLICVFSGPLPGRKFIDKVVIPCLYASVCNIKSKCDSILSVINRSSPSGDCSGGCVGISVLAQVRLCIIYYTVCGFRILIRQSGKRRFVCSVIVQHGIPPAVGFICRDGAIAVGLGGDIVDLYIRRAGGIVGGIELPQPARDIENKAAVFVDGLPQVLVHIVAD